MTRNRSHRPTVSAVAMFASAEAALRAALTGDSTEFAEALDKAAEETRRRGTKYLPLPVPKITVVVNCRPADGRGHNVFVAVTTVTISAYEAQLAAMSEVNRQHLRAPVVVAIERH